MAKKPIIDNSVNEIRSNQDLSCNWTGSADFGRLVPFSIDELLPTDKVITCRPRIEMQMLPLASPTFGKMDLYVHYFAVPLRLLADDFYSVWSQTGTGKSSQLPRISLADLNKIYKTEQSGGSQYFRSWYKHWTSLGLPPFFEVPLSGSNSTLSGSTYISLLKFRAYNQIWWDFYRDPEVIRDDSKSNYIDTSMGTKSSSYNAANFLSPHLRTIQSNWIADLFASPGYSPADANPLDSMPTGLMNVAIDFANADTEVASSSASTSHDFRLIEALTRLSERLSLGGKRQIEALYARYGVKPDWAKMNMCQYVGGAKETVLVSDITSSADTSALDSSTGRPLGAKAGAGYCSFSDLNINFTATEPCYLIGLFSVMPHIHYVQGIDKSWMRNSLADFFQKTLEHVGNVAVAKREIAVKYANVVGSAATIYSPSGNDSDTFAYRDPYYEYKVGRDILAGDFMRYHNATDSTQEGTLSSDLQYMQSMEQYIDFPTARTFAANNLLVDGQPFNKIFYYLGGTLFGDYDDHFHLCIDKQIVINRPMDGFAVPTIDTTENPHAAKSSVGSDTVL